jgi:hypothetical protein
MLMKGWQGNMRSWRSYRFPNNRRTTTHIAPEDPFQIHGPILVELSKLEGTNSISILLNSNQSLVTDHRVWGSQMANLLSRLRRVFSAGIVCSGTGPLHLLKSTLPWSFLPSSRFHQRDCFEQWHDKPFSSRQGQIDRGMTTIPCLTCESLAGSGLLGRPSHNSFDR